VFGQVFDEANDEVNSSLIEVGVVSVRRMTGESGFRLFYAIGVLGIR
jgi:hypothetical protein